MQVRMRQLALQRELTAAAYKSLVQSGSRNTTVKWLTPICSNTVPTLSASLALSPTLKAAHHANSQLYMRPWPFLSGAVLTRICSSL